MQLSSMIFDRLIMSCPTSKCSFHKTLLWIRLSVSSRLGGNFGNMNLPWAVFCWHITCGGSNQFVLDFYVACCTLQSKLCCHPSIVTNALARSHQTSNKSINKCDVNIEHVMLSGQEVGKQYMERQVKSAPLRLCTPYRTEPHTCNGRGWQRTWPQKLQQREPHQSDGINPV